MSGNLITTSNIQPNFKLVNVQIIFSRNCSKLSTDIKQFLDIKCEVNVTKKDRSYLYWLCLSEQSKVWGELFLQLEILSYNLIIQYTLYTILHIHYTGYRIILYNTYMVW